MFVYTFGSRATVLLEYVLLRCSASFIDENYYNQLPKKTLAIRSLMLITEVGISLINSSFLTTKDKMVGTEGATTR